MPVISNPAHRLSRRGRSFAARLVSAGAIVLLLLAGCDTDSGLTAPAPIDLRSNNVILTWNNLVYDALTTHDEYANPLVATRVYAMVHVAQHDAINAIAPIFESYALDGGPTGIDRDADPVAAGAAAAHGVLSALFPEQTATFDAQLALALASVTDASAAARGVALGEQAATSILQQRQNDGADTPPVGDYVPGTGPGRYQPTPPFGFAFAPGWTNVVPFAITEAKQFRSPPPPALNSEAYAAAFNEVKAVGRDVSETRTAEQTAYAQFWYEFSDIGWNRIARIVAADRNLGLQSTARLFALLNIAMADSYIAGWDSKFHYDVWRPYTAIREADTDGNAATRAEADWEPAAPTPPVQDYPSTHSVLGNAATAVLASVFGDDVSFTFHSTSADPAHATRSFASFSEAADENADSRVMAGIHFRFASDAGQELGRSIGQWAIGNHLRTR